MENTKQFIMVIAIGFLFEISFVGGYFYAKDVQLTKKISEISFKIHPNHRDNIRIFNLLYT